MADIILGTDAQVRTVRQAEALWRLLCDDPRFAYQGRTVSLAEEVAGAADLVIGLSRIQGYASCQFVSSERAGQLTQAYGRAGLTPLVWHQYWGRERAQSAAATFMEDYQPPDGVGLKFIDSNTPDSTIHRIAEMSLAAGVLPAPGRIMRSEGIRSVFAYAETADGEIVATGGGSMAFHPAGSHPDEAFWGMLATHSDWRGKRLACWVGAAVICELGVRFGARGFSSGVKPDNPSSQAMCTRLGIGAPDFVYVGAVDPAAFGGEAVTR